MKEPDVSIEFPENFRPQSMNQKKLNDGIYAGVLKKVEKKTLIPSGRKVIEFSIEIKIKDGRTTIVKLSPDNDIESPWLQKTLINLGHKLTAGKKINLEQNIGAKVEVEISNVKKGDKTYCNIVKMVKIDAGSKIVDNKTPDKSSSKAKSESLPSPKGWDRQWDDDSDEDDDDSDEDDE